MRVDWGLLTAATIIAALHALLPTHWMPFILVGRAQGWRGRQILGVVAVAGLGHAVVTCLLGLAFAWAGERAMHRLEGFEIPFTVTVLGAFGAWFLWKGRHHGEPAGHVHEVNLSDRTAAISLILLLSLQPCGAAMPLFLSAGPLVEWPAMVTAALLMSGITVLIMVALTSMTLMGVRQLSLEWAEHNEKLVIGALFLVLAAGAALFHEALEHALAQLHLHPPHAR